MRAGRGRRPVSRPLNYALQMSRRTARGRGVRLPEWARRKEWEAQWSWVVSAPLRQFSLG